MLRQTGGRARAGERKAVLVHFCLKKQVEIRNTAAFFSASEEDVNITTPLASGFLRWGLTAAT